MRFWTFCVQGHMKRHQAFNEDRSIVTALPFHRHPYWAVFEDQLDETECLSPSSQSPIASNYRRKSLTSHWSASLQSTQDHSKSIPIVADGEGVFVCACVRARACVCVCACPVCESEHVRVQMCLCTSSSYFAEGCGKQSLRKDCEEHRTVGWKCTREIWERLTEREQQKNIEY